MLSLIINDFLNGINLYFSQNNILRKNKTGNIKINYFENYDRIPENIGIYEGNSLAEMDVLFFTNNGNYVQYYNDEKCISITGFYDFSSKENSHSNLFHVYREKIKIFSFLDITGDVLINGNKITNIKSNDEFDFYFSLKDETNK